MGKAKSSMLTAGTPSGTEPPDSWMRELRLQTVEVDATRWSQPSQRHRLWPAGRPHVRPVRYH
jgi:hypothetical protein